MVVRSLSPNLSSRQLQLGNLSHAQEIDVNVLLLEDDKKIAAAIDKYVYITVHQTFDPN